MSTTERVARSSIPLEPEAQQFRPQMLSEVFTQCQTAVEVDDGYRLRFSDSTWLARLETIESVSRERWPALSISVSRGPGDDVWLDIRGPDGTKEFVESLREIHSTYLNPKSLSERERRSRRAALTARLRVLPDFLIIGAKKSGTTSLYWYLTQHPGVMPAYCKEVNFYQHNYHRGMAWYARFFPTVVEKYGRSLRQRPVLSCEATPDYIYFPVVAERVAETLPDARLIAVLRNPIDRAYSAYHHRVRRGVERRTFDEIVREELSESRDRTSRQKGSYLEKGIYAAYLQYWFDRFHRDRILVLATEEMSRDPHGNVGKTLSFLGLRPHALDHYRKQNSAPYPPMSVAVRERLMEYFEPHNERLFGLLGGDLGWNA